MLQLFLRIPLMFEELFSPWVEIRALRERFEVWRSEGLMGALTLCSVSEVLEMRTCLISLSGAS